jgi:outer membrane protein assembly factor BamB
MLSIYIPVQAHVTQSEEASMRKSRHVIVNILLLMSIFIGFSVLQAQLAGAETTLHTITPTINHKLPHILKTRHAAHGSISRFDTSQNLLYNGGPVMQTTSTTYAIFWEPPTLQDDTPTQVSSTYNTLLERYFNDIGGSGVYANDTQYYDTNGSIINSSTFGGVYVDTSAYPASGCSDQITPNDCLTDAQIQAEVTKAMAANHWTSGLTHMFFVFTSQGEGSCFDGTSTSCAFTDYCAYHSYFDDNQNQPVIYANMPYTGTALDACGVSTSPNNDYDADSTINVTSHEHMEAVTDPLLNAWYDNQGYEIGDKCAWNFGTPSLNNGSANVEWNNDYYIVQQEWSNQIGNCTLSAPITQQDGILYAGSNDGYLYALDASTGSLLWRYKTGGPVTSSPLIANGIVYVGSKDHYVYAINATNGTLDWRYKTANAVLSSAALSGNSLYIGSTDGYLYALNATSGTLTWRYATHKAISTTPVVSNNTVFVTSNNGILYALDATQGTLLWHVQPHRTLFTSFAIDNGLIYAGTNTGLLYALNASNRGAVLWSYKIGTPIEATPTIAGSVIYVSSASGYLYALNASNRGKRLWSYRTRSSIPAQVTVNNGLVYFTALNHYLYALNATNGSQAWHFRTSNVVLAAVAVANSMVYFGSNDRDIYALNGLTQKLSWHYRTGGAVQSSPMLVQ